MGHNLPHLVAVSILERLVFATLGRIAMKWIGNALRPLVPAASSAFRIDGMGRLAISSPAEALALARSLSTQGITAHCLDQSYAATREAAMAAFAKSWRA